MRRRISEQHDPIAKVSEAVHYWMALTDKNAAKRGWLLENLVFMQLRRGFNKMRVQTLMRSGEVECAWQIRLIS